MKTKVSGFISLLIGMLSLFGAKVAKAEPVAVVNDTGLTETIHVDAETAQALVAEGSISYNPQVNGLEMRIHILDQLQKEGRLTNINVRLSSECGI